ncbi:hypothetical protein Tco_1471209 [Tanacetum coccineum]
MVNPENEELPKELSGIVMIVKMVKTTSSFIGITRRIDYSLIRNKNQRCRVLYKVEDIAACLVEYVKLWDDWEVDRYGNANLVIMEYLVKLSKRHAFWSLNEDILKITVLTTYTLYPSKKIRRIRA